MSSCEENWGVLEKDLVGSETLRLCLEQLLARELDEASRATTLKLSPWINLSYLQGKMDFISSEDLWQMDFLKLMEKLRGLGKGNDPECLETQQTGTFEAKVLFLEAMGVVYALIFYDRLKTAQDLVTALSETPFSHQVGIRESLDYLEKLIHLKRATSPNLAQKIAAILDLTDSKCKFMETSGQWRNSLWHKAYGTQLVFAMIMNEEKLSSTKDGKLSNLKWGIELQLSDLRYQAQYYRWTELGALLEEHEPMRFHRLEDCKDSLEAAKDFMMSEWAVDSLVFGLKEILREKESLGQFNEALRTAKMLIEIYERG